ncbi:M56 family metallopeptidase [Spirosoma areae]
MNALPYLLKANLYGLLFVGCYWLLLRRHTFFSVNRGYLLLSAVLSLVLPLVSLSAQTVDTLPVPMGVISLPITAVVNAPIVAGPDWEQIGMIAYGLISLVFLLRVLVRVGRLASLIRRSPRQVGDGYVRVQPSDLTIPTFSFFQYMILNPADSENDLIISHELVHIRQHHSLDVVAIALLRAIFWPCAALWLIDRMLRQVHEFLADKPANQPADYARFLVEYTFGVWPDTLTNGFFNPSLLKQRIQMLHQRATTRWALGKYVLVIPLAMSLLAMTTAREEIATMVIQATNETITVSGRVTSAVEGKGLPGVNVVIANTTQGTTTDSEGKYTLTNVPKDASLVLSFVGFTTQDIKVNGQTTLNVSMSLQTNKLSDVVVVAYEPVPEPTLPKQSSETKPTSQTSPTGEVFTVVEQQPQFPGGMTALGQYLTHNLRYPKEAQQNKVQGRVFVQFVITQTGQIQDLRVLKGIGSGCDEEAVRVVSQMPKWNPGQQQGQAVAVQYNLPIQFSLEKRQEDKRTGQVPGPQPDSAKKVGFIIDNSKNGRFALYNDVTTESKERYSMPLPDSLRRSGLPITIRGNGLSAGEPLYMLDGVEIPKSIINTIDAKNIETITVLKNAATAVYGPKALHGVVLITTKKK